MQKHLFSLIIVLIFSTLGHFSKAEDLFKVSKKIKPETLKEVANVTLLDINPEEFNRLSSSKEKFHNVQLPINGKVTELYLKRERLSEREYLKITSKSGRNLKQDLKDFSFLKGQVKGDPKSVVVLGLFRNSVQGMISFQGENYVLTTEGGQWGKGETILFPESELPEHNPFHCGLDDGNYKDYHKGKEDFHSPLSTNKAVQNTCKTVRIAVEADYWYYEMNGSNTQNTAANSTLLMEINNTLFSNEVINIQVTNILVWDQPDPYQNLNTSQQLSDFTDLNGTRTDADLVHLLSGADLNRATAGGIAFLSAICSDFKTGISLVNLQFANLPVYSWSVSVIAHELGHNFSSRHTQSCTWELSPGVFGPIDTCINVEGQCYNGPLIPRTGTIMSYCHLLAQIDLSLGFGPLPGDRMRQFVAGLSCLSGDVVPFFQPQVISSNCYGGNVSLQANPNPTGATVIWEGPNGFSATGPTVDLGPLTTANEGLYTIRAVSGTCESQPISFQVSATCFSFASRPKKEFCQGQTFSLPFQTNGDFNANNTFQLQISSPSGDFASPLVLATLTQSFEGTFSGTIPTTLPVGNTYKLRIVSSSPSNTYAPFADEVSIAKSPLAPEAASPIGVCGTATTTLIASSPSGEDLIWYDAASPANVLGRGNTLVTPALVGTSNYFVGNDPGLRQSVGPIDTTGLGVSYRNRYSKGVLFRVLRPLTIDSVTILAENTGTLRMNVKPYLAKGQLGVQIHSTTNVIQQPGFHKLRLNAVLEPGLYYLDAIGSTNISLGRSLNNIVYPYTIPNTIELLGGNASLGDLSDVYFYFYNWRVSPSLCQDLRTQVTVQVLDTVATPVIGRNSASSDTIRVLTPFPSNAEYRWFVNQSPVQNNNFPYLLISQHLRNPNDVATLKVAIIGCESNNSNPVVVTNLPQQLGSSTSLKVFPNPTSGSITLQNTNAESFNYQLTDVLGKQIANGTLQPEISQHLNLQQLPTGIYLLKTSSGQTIKLKKE